MRDGNKCLPLPLSGSTVVIHCIAIYPFPLRCCVSCPLPGRRCECAGDKGRLLDELLLDLAAAAGGEGGGRGGSGGGGISGEFTVQQRLFCAALSA